MSEVTPEQETALMRRICEQDQQALSALYDQFGRAVYSVAYRILQQQQSAEEVTQDVFLTVWRRAEQWDGAKGKLISWILKITQNQAIDRIRKENRTPTVLDEPFDDMYNLSNPAHVDTTLWQMRQQFGRYFNELPPEQSEVLQLGFYYGMTHSQMAEHLSLPLGTVKTRVRSGLQKVRQLWLADADSVTERNPNA